MKYIDPENDLGEAPHLSAYERRQRFERRQKRQEKACERRGELPLEQATAEAKEAALTMLDRMNRTRRDLEQRLKKKGFQPNAIDAALTRLEDVGIIDDRQLAYALVRDRFERKGVVGQALRQDLMRKGVVGELLDEAVASVDEDQRKERIDDLLRRQLRTKDASDPKQRQRITSHLARKGYSYSEISAALHRYLAEDNSSLQ